MNKPIFFPVSFLLLGLSGCASTHDPLADVLGPEPSYLICKNSPPTGSRIPRTNCMSQDDWESKEEETKEIVDEWFRLI